jgi:hypothetical protein
MIDIDVDEIIKVPCKKKWKKRNKEIYKRYINHETVEELSEAYRR